MTNEDRNPIDKDKVAENPGLLPYAHTIGSAVIRPEDTGKIKGRAVTAMRQQTQRQMDQLYQQMQTLVDQANALKRRVEVSERIYQTQLGFDPIIGNTYYLYERLDGTDMLSMIGPAEWGRSRPFKRFVAQATLLADHTWDVQYHDEGQGQ
jgi:hypothetical protein